MAAKKKSTAKKTASKSVRSKPRAAGKATSPTKAKKGSARKPVARKPAAKKPAARKPAAKAAAKKKAPAPARKKAAPAKKQPVAASRKSATSRKPAAKPTAKKAAVKPSNNKTPSDAGEKSGNGAVAKPARGRANRHLTSRELKTFERLLLNLRDQVVDEISFLTGDNLSNPQLERTGEEGTDNFNREFALKLVSSEQDIIYEIDEALRRIKNGTYGLCESSGEQIEKERLKVLPHARHCIRVQSELEKGRARFRPFGPTISRA